MSVSDLMVLGLSHQSAPVEIRERVALEEDVLRASMRNLHEQGLEVMWLSTCNRVEVYVASEDVERAEALVRAQLLRFGGPGAEPHLYLHRAEAALVHLFRVASSLESMVVGEPQILGQVKEALELAKDVGAVGSELVRACSAAFGAAKRVRSETGIGRAAVSMASAAVALAGKILGELKGRNVLLVGAGEMAEHAARHLRQAGVQTLWITNRTRARAEALAQAVGGEVKSFDALDAHLAQADVVVCTTASSRPIFTKERVAATLRQRRGRMLFMVDLAVPRDIAPDVSELDGVYTYDVDDVQRVVSENAAARAQEAERAQHILSEEVLRYARDRALRESMPTLVQLRRRAEAVARAEAQRTLANLGPGLNERQRRSVEAMAVAIVNKLLHEPTVRLRAAADNETHHHLVDAASELFGLETPASAPEVDEVPELRRRVAEH
ncbi:MAG TPA: glutamyl-tRNA reductase [Myxococcaceae bacterium]|nr:glutamyl-tRNA reductase [Myxococcaceae bacterium]